jgi:hypothetical protein
MADAVAVERERVKNRVVQGIPQRRQISFAEFKRHGKLVLHLQAIINDDK